MRSLARTRNAARAFCIFALTPKLAVSARTPEQSIHYALTPDGALGAWNFGGPCESLAVISPSAKPGYGEPCPLGRWRGAADASGDFDWSALLAVPSNTPGAVAAGVWLQTRRRFEGWLLVAADGQVKLAVDGQWVHRRQLSQQRGRALVPIPLELEPGIHRLLLAIERQGNQSRISALLREKSTNLAPSDLTVHLPAGPEEHRLVEQLASLSLSVVLRSQSEPFLSVGLAFPSGFLQRPLPIQVEFRKSTTQPALVFKAGTLAAERLGSDSFRIHLGPLSDLVNDEPSTLTIRVGDTRLVRQLSLTRPALASLERANRIRHSTVFDGRDRSGHDALAATFDANWSQISELLVQPSPLPLEQAVRRFNQFLDRIEAGDNPFHQTGRIDAYLRSPYDGRPTSVLTHVPEAYRLDQAKERPLVVVLHGYNGTPQRILDAFLDANNRAASTKVDGFVIAPAAHGNSFYRGPGEQAVLDAINWAMSTYPIDRSRISITGVSMGGTGAAEIAFRHSEVFAAAAPLCGYHSYFVRRDTTTKPIRPWERVLMHRFSPASWAESGNDIPLFVAHGTKDLPLENSKILTTRYRALGYQLAEDWPDLGHAVWKKTYRNAAMYPWLAKWQKDLDPSRVVVASTSRANGRKFWLEIAELGGSDDPAMLDGRVVSPTELEVNTRNVSAFRVGSSRLFVDGGEMRVTIDQDSVIVPAGMPREFSRTNSHWQLTERAASKALDQHRVEGPWAELFSAPLAVVWGSGNPSTLALNREVARRLVQARAGLELDIPVIPDTEFAPLQSTLTRVIYVGRPDDHRHLAHVESQLPIKLMPAGISIGKQRFDENDVGVAFVYPDPYRRDRLLGVVSANGPEGLWRVLALPGLVPDFAVFDRGVDAAAGEPVLGRAAYLRAAGFFKSDWSLPESFLDPLAPKEP